MKKISEIFFKYIFLCVFAFWVLFFYYQITTYPLKVDRWVQPIEGVVVSIAAKQCLTSNSWLNMFVEHAVKHQGAYSAQVVFLTSEKMLQSCEIGYKNKIFNTPLNAADRYRYASTSKLVTTAAVLDLVYQGKIHLDDAVVSFLPELTRFEDERIRQITVSHLLNHNAGFNRLTLNGDPMFLRRNKPWCPHKLNQLESLVLAFNPGEKQVYSNVGYCLLGEVIHRVTGDLYRDYVTREFELGKRNIKFVNDYFYDDEVRYDYRYEEWFNDTYLKLFDFDAISSAAGLSGSATELAKLLWDVHHKQHDSPFALRAPADNCNLQKVTGCLSLGVFHYQPEKYGMTLHFHEGYLPGSASVAVIDSFGGVTVLLKSGANRYQKNPENEWIRWIYKRLSLHYTLQGRLPILNFAN